MLNFLTAILSLTSAVAFTLGRPSSIQIGARGETLKMSQVTLPDLPYAPNALEPYIGEQTLLIHHGKHHARYVTVTKELIANTDLENADIETITKKSYKTNQALFNNAAQCWNHAFYWKCMKPGGGGVATGKVLSLIEKSFGSFDAFKKEFANAGMTAFGSGWAWLVYVPSSGALKITKTIGADTPLTDADSVPILTMDVWEHAYYLNYQNLRATYIDTYLDKLVNWDFVNSNLP